MGTTRILIIEDHADCAHTLQLLLQWMGYQVEVAYTGTDGVRVAMEWEPNVIISDIGLPRLDGFEVARQLRQNPSTAHILLIAVSGYGTAEFMDRAASAGFDYYFVKPLDPQRLFLLLRRRAAREDRPCSPASTTEPPSRAPA
jgi:CheY-like chemotaxis protein